MLLAMLLGVPAQQVMACEPFPDNWYIETVTLDTSGLPADFHIYSDVDSSPEQLSEGVWLTTNNPASSRRAMIYLINRSKTPVYIMSLEYRDRLVMATPDANFAARVKMAHEAASFLVRPNSGEVFTLEWEALMDVDHSLIDPNLPRFEYPPADTAPPAAQHSDLLMVYGDQVILLPFTISYSVNKDFNIDDCGGSPMSAPQPTFVQAADNEPGAGKVIVLVSGGIILIIGSAWLVWRWRSHR
ncbi:MAG: hypothetical protein A2Z49_05530 [Chloroflexi bacterium RBG_19FT_COMBO_56_12]|nr:MAG: hypothetical protein A2Z49_05530 [Chloroflexi bacterium RBG_19FT_COMBO_56_12]